LVIGGSFSGLAAGRDLGRHFLVTIIDAKEFGETGEAGASLGLGQL
jgi:glycine/D-amino acid oxidase-like deaminating enzyme